MDGGAEWGDAAREHLLHSLLSTRADARIIALSGDGLPVPMPGDVTVPGGVVVGRGKLGETVRYVVPEDQVGVVDAWLRMRNEGVAWTRARMLDHPLVPVDLYLIDWRHRSGVVLAVMVRSSAASVSAATGRGPAADEAAPGSAEGAWRDPRPAGLRPRVGTVQRDNLSVVLEADEASAQMLGFSVPEMLGVRTLDLIHPDDTELAIAQWMDMLAGPGTYRRIRLRHRTGDGGWLWVELTNHNLLDDPVHRCVVGQMVDVSQEVAATEALREKDRLLHRITEALPVGVAHIGPDRAVRYRNPRLQDMLGTALGSGLDDQLRSLRAPDGTAVLAAVEAVLAGGPDAELEVQLLPARGARHCQVTVGGLTAPDGARIGAIVCVADVTDSVRLREQLQERVTRDELTGCLNRAGALARTGELLAHATQGSGVAVVFVDLDDFKLVNDRHGHVVGDRALREFARSLRAASRTEDVVGRLGGDEFIVACPRIGSAASALGVVERLEAALGTVSVEADGHLLELRSSLGVTWSAGGEDAETVVARADTRMYDRKRGRERPADGSLTA